MKNFINNFKEFKKKPNSNAIMFFGFYIIFFVILFMVIGIKGDRNSLFQEYEKGNKGYFNNTGVMSKNYFYDYKIYLNGVLYDYYGRRNDNIEVFKFNNNDYYRDGNEYYLNNIVVDNPYIFYEMIDVDNFNNIFSNAYYNSKTEYEDGRVDYNYLISSNSLNKLLYDVDTDFEEVPNNIVFSTDDENNLNKIVYNLDNYCLNSDLCNSLKIELNYELFGNVSNLEKQVE